MRMMGLHLAALVCCASCGDAGNPPGPSAGVDAAVTPPPCSADTLNDPQNCGACGRACDAEESCTSGVCAPRDPLPDYASCRDGTERDPRCGFGRNCVSVGSGGPRVCAPSCALDEARCPAAPAGSDARPACTRLVLRCLLACTGETTCPAGQTCRLLPPAMTSGYCAP